MCVCKLEADTHLFFNSLWSRIFFRKNQSKLRHNHKKPSAVLNFFAFFHQSRTPPYFSPSLPPSFLSLALSYFSTSCTAVCAPAAPAKELPPPFQLHSPLPSLSRQPSCGGGLSHACVCVCVFAVKQKLWKKKNKQKLAEEEKYMEGTSCWYLFRCEVKAGGGI